MVKALFDAVMERRADRLVEHVRPWLPDEGCVLDLGSGTGHVAARVERELGLPVTTADVSDIHVTGPRPVPIADGPLPFDRDAFSGTLLLFMLAYPDDPVRVLAEAARVTRGPVIVVQTVSANRVGAAWHRGRELLWTVAAFHASRIAGYVSRSARFSMRTRRFYTEETLRRDVLAAGLRICARRATAVLPGGALVVVGWRLERDA